MYAIKSFVVVWCLFVYTEGGAEKFLGLNIYDHHELFVRKCNQVFALSGNKIDIAPEFTYAVYGLMAAAIGFLTVKPNINYAFYFYVMTRSASKDGTNRYLESRSEGHRFTFGQLIKLCYANFMAPIFISFLFMHELTGSLVMSAFGISEITWSGIRLLLVLIMVYMRYVIFREELQF